MNTKIDEVSEENMVKETTQAVEKKEVETTENVSIKKSEEKLQDSEKAK